MALPQLINKAIRLIPYVKETGFVDRDSKKWFFSFPAFKDNKIDIIIVTEDGRTKLLQCTCLFHSTKDPKCEALCSYYLSCLFKLAQKNENNNK